MQFFTPLKPGGKTLMKILSFQLKKHSVRSIQEFSFLLKRLPFIFRTSALENRAGEAIELDVWSLKPPESVLPCVQ